MRFESEPVRPAPTDPITDDARKEVNRVQLALLHEANSSQRANLLERLFQAEQVLAPVEQPRSRLQQAAIRAQPVERVKECHKSHTTQRHEGTKKRARPR